MLRLEFRYFAANRPSLRFPATLRLEFRYLAAPLSSSTLATPLSSIALPFRYIAVSSFYTSPIVILSSLYTVLATPFRYTAVSSRYTVTTPTPLRILLLHRYRCTFPLHRCVFPRHCHSLLLHLRYRYFIFSLHRYRYTAASSPYFATPFRYTTNAATYPSRHRLRYIFAIVTASSRYSVNATPSRYIFLQHRHTAATPLTPLRILLPHYCIAYNTTQCNTAIFPPHRRRRCRIFPLHCRRRRT